jgi:hypothetical protein
MSYKKSSPAVRCWVTEGRTDGHRKLSLYFTLCKTYAGRSLVQQSVPQRPFCSNLEPRAVGRPLASWGGGEIRQAERSACRFLAR